MNKFYKRITKVADGTHSCLVLNSAVEFLEDFSNIFDTVFVYKDQEPVVRRKNIVYQEFFDELINLPKFNLVFTDIDGLKNLFLIERLLVRQHPIIMVRSENYIDKNFSDFLKNCQYVIVDIAKGYQIWKKK
jgi:hypothetical protein